MGRQKQTTPLRREVSSEYTSKADRTPRGPGRNMETMFFPIVSNGHVNGKVIAGSAVKEKAQPGIPQLIMAVGGIYASL
jgi:UDP-galactose transporter B1